MTGDEALARAVTADFRRAELAPRERALLEFAEKVTLRPRELGREDVEELRRHGYGDRGILDAAHVIGYFNHINRVVDALGIELEPGMPPDPRRG